MPVIASQMEPKGPESLPYYRFRKAVEERLKRSRELEASANFNSAQPQPSLELLKLYTHSINDDLPMALEMLDEAVRMLEKLAQSGQCEADRDQARGSMVALDCIASEDLPY